MNAQYIVIPADKSASWSSILDHAASRYDVAGNDFIGSRQYNAPSGKIVFKLYR